MNDEQLKKWRDSLPEVEPTPDEIEAIKTAREQIANGEYISFSSIEEMKKYFLNEEEDAEA